VDTRSVYFQGCHGLVLVYDIASEKSFVNLNERLEEYSNYVDSSQHTIKMVIGNKIDKDARRVVDYQTGLQYANSISANFCEVSCATGQNVVILLDKF
jgi:GTPase SAR1 family protein